MSRVGQDHTYIHCTYRVYMYVSCVYVCTVYICMYGVHMYVRWYY
jgi:hypothetical protein